MTHAPFGTWPSPLDPVAVANGTRLGAVGTANGALVWTEARPTEGGRNVLVRLTDGGPEDVLPPPWSVRTRVHEYGGRAWGEVPGGIVFSHDPEGALYVVGPGAPRRVTAPSGWRFAEPTWDPLRGRLIAVGEHHGAGATPDNHLVAVDLETGSVEILTSGADFYAAPAVSEDGRLAWLQWRHPHMPWDAAELWVRDGQGDHHVTGGPTGSAWQPTWHGSSLWCALEVDDRWQIHRDGVRLDHPLLDGEAGAPLWQLGTRTFGVLADGSCVVSQFRRGLSQVVRAGPGIGQVLDDTLGYVGDLQLVGRRVALSIGWAGAAGQIVLLDPDTGATETLADAVSSQVHPGDVSVPVPVPGPVPAFFYAPRLRGYEGPEGARPPLIVVVHGGPTGNTSPTLSPRIQFWTTRGFAVLDVNYRGSTGYGRAWREALRGGWGLVDVADVVAAAEQVASLGWVDPDRMVIRGGSAGGYTVLQALANHRVFRAGACHYGISDLSGLTSATHKFESHYDRYLIGAWPEEAATYRARSPLFYPERITVPVVFFQGLEDKAVPPDQTERMARALQARGIDAPFHAYAGEQHGFRKAETLRDVHEKELDFYRRTLRLT